MENKIVHNEDSIKRIIRESIGKVLKENKDGILLEMALPRKTYKERIVNLIPQLLENWCLVRYCTIVGNIPTKSHWQSELRGVILTISRLTMSGNDSVESRHKVLDEIWNDEDYYIPHTLNMTIANKFITENISIKSEEYGNVLLDCIESKENIFNVILQRDIESITRYVENI